jgi:hypothetical protein
MVSTRIGCAWLAAARCVLLVAQMPEPGSAARRAWPRSTRGWLAAPPPAAARAPDPVRRRGGRNAGTAVGWASSALYVGSRVSQIVKTAQRRSAEGLALSMFLAAILANSLYGAGAAPTLCPMPYALTLRLVWHCVPDGRPGQQFVSRGRCAPCADGLVTPRRLARDMQVRICRT